MGDPILGSNEELIKDQGDTRPDLVLKQEIQNQIQMEEN